MASPSSPRSSDFDLDLEKIYLDIDPAVQAQAWQRSQALANSGSQWRAYINELALRSLIAWLPSFMDTATSPASTGGNAPKSMLRDALWPTVWEWVNGSACEVGREVGALRWVLIPSEAIDDDELRVPQEWIDIPAWVGDYYLLMQVNADEGWVKIAGGATHAVLKEQGEYDGRDRTYSLPASELFTDVNVMGVAEAIVPNAIKRAAVAPVPELPLAQANQLMQRLSDSEQLNPRLAVGFDLWRALLSHGGWRMEMTQQRQGNPPSGSVRQWLQDGLSQWVQQLGWQTVTFQPATVGARGDDDEMPQAALSKVILIAGDRYQLQVLEQVLITDGDQLNAWRFELRKLNGVIPLGITLRLLTEELKAFENNSATATEPVEVLFVDVALAPGEGIVWITEPEPDEYETEILRF